MDILRKQYDVDVTVEEGKREVVSIISTDDIDRDGEVVIPKGLVKKNYAGNPVILLNHNWDSLPIGKSLGIKAQGNKLFARSYITDKTEIGRDAFELVKEGILTAISIGFSPLEQGPPTEKEILKRPELAQARNIIRKWELLEYSFVTIPANPQALSLSVSKSLSPTIKQFLDINEEDVTETTEDVDDDKTITIPSPKFHQCWNDQVNELKMINVSVNDVLDRYRGRL